ncbi:UDP-N-acetylmuramoyl-L-alanine--D-glutamate ligase [Rhodoluna limnophila]|uniref:UDP-N-acetylmuramoyl-L-alanine--D-glutamate ligase n=1 Tax=Rhodoluna limnophila TaxID=232537 RepID=UPI0011060F6E|nr:UDP-N-acetylmuramoyl-L-alanine--D-glutamate ligase [Rhodoluna limnophila]
MNELEKLNSWHADWRGLRVVVFGLGVTGFSVADTLAELGCQVLVVAEKADPELLDILDVIGVTHITDEAAKGLPQQVIDFEPQLIVTSPGVRPEHDLLSWSAEQSIPIWVDIDLAWRVRDKTTRVADWLVVTGTNGKTTTVQMVEAMLNRGGKKAIACGNIGTPILDAIRDPEGFDALIVELSSFQLHYLGEIHPYSSAVLNLADDHLDWHGSFEAYRDAKAKVYENTAVACVYNTADLATEKMVENADVHEGARAIGFTTGTPGRSQVGFVEDILCDRAFLDDRANSALEIATLDDLSKIGVLTPHLMANAAAAVAMARSYAIDPADVRAALLDFRLDAHRIELVAEQDGIRWIDDSKATNPHAAAASLNSFEKVIWVVGGLLKGVDLNDLVKKFADRLSAAIVIGVDRSHVVEVLSTQIPNLPVVEISSADNTDVMPQVVAAASKFTESGSVVLLAPAAASMDQFKDYADRGNQFAEAVRAHLETP